MMLELFLMFGKSKARVLKKSCSLKKKCVQLLWCLFFSSPHKYRYTECGSCVFFWLLSQWQVIAYLFSPVFSKTKSRKDDSRQKAYARFLFLMEGTWVRYSGPISSGKSENLHSSATAAIATMTEQSAMIEPKMVATLCCATPADGGGATATLH